MSPGNRTAGIAGEVYLCDGPRDAGRREKVYQFFLHLPISNIHNGEWVGVLFAAYVFNSLQIHRMASGSGQLEADIYTDRSGNLGRFCNCMAYYVWNFQRVYNSRIRVSHVPRWDAWLSTQNTNARRARTLPIGTEIGLASLRWANLVAVGPRPFDEMVMLKDPIRWETVIGATVVGPLLVPLHALPTVVV